MPVTVKQTNPKALEKLLRRYKSNATLAIGFPVGTSSAGLSYPDGTPLLDVAVYNNYGTRRIPRRDFMTPGGKKAVENTMPIAAGLIPEVNAGNMTVEQVLTALGPTAETGMKTAIKELNSPPNSPTTVEIKGSSNPLIDTGLLVTSPTHKVRSKA